NLSSVPPLLSDRLCTLATGGGNGKRRLYEDEEEVLFDAKRPVILTGIDELATRGDLLDRSILVYPPRIEKYKPESELLSEFEKYQPSLLGAVVDGVVSALANRHNVQPDTRQRMADFTTWVTAASEGLGWIEEQFIEAYSHNRKIAN